MTKTLALALLLGTSLTSVEAAAKEKGDWLVRLRGIYVTANEDATITPIGGNAKIGSEYTPELDISYFFTDNIAAELILATTKHSVAATGTGIGDVPLGKVWLLPPTLNLQYHLAPKSTFSPYVGVGANLTMFYGEKAGPVISGLGGSIDYDTFSFGFGVQAGLDVAIGDNAYINFDAKRLWLNTDATVNAGILGIVTADVDINPWIFGVGLGSIF